MPWRWRLPVGTALQGGPRRDGLKAVLYSNPVIGDATVTTDGEQV